MRPISSTALWIRIRREVKQGREEWVVGVRSLLRRLHDLRHSCATLLLAQGISPRVVMEVLGHSQIALTMNTYTHVLPELRRDAADRMNDLIVQRQ